VLLFFALQKSHNVCANFAQSISGSRASCIILVTYDRLCWPLASYLALFKYFRDIVSSTGRRNCRTPKPKKFPSCRSTVSDEGPRTTDWNGANSMYLLVQVMRSNRNRRAGLIASRALSGSTPTKVAIVALWTPPPTRHRVEPRPKRPDRVFFSTERAS